VSGWALFAQAGCIANYGPNLQDAYRHLAVYADRILNGAKPSSLPVEQPTKFELVINLKTAKALGVTIPQPPLLGTDGAHADYAPPPCLQRSSQSAIFTPLARSAIRCNARLRGDLSLLTRS
jgi:hypothetical protein